MAKLKLSYYMRIIMSSSYKRNIVSRLIFFFRGSGCLLGDAWGGEDYPEYSKPFNAFCWWGYGCGLNWTFVRLEGSKIQCSFPKLLQVSSSDKASKEVDHIFYCGTIGVSMLYMCCFPSCSQNSEKTTPWLYRYYISHRCFYVLVWDFFPFLMLKW